MSSNQSLHHGQTKDVHLHLLTNSPKGMKGCQELILEVNFQIQNLQLQIQTKELFYSLKNSVWRFFFWAQKIVIYRDWDLATSCGHMTYLKKCPDIWFCPLGLATFCHVADMSWTFPTKPAETKGEKGWVYHISWSIRTMEHKSHIQYLTIYYVSKEIIFPNGAHFAVLITWEKW